MMTMTISQKYNALKNLEKILSNEEAAARYSVSRSTLSTWVKNKRFSQHLNSLKKLPSQGHERMIRIRLFFKWFNSIRSQQIPIDGPMFRQMAVNFAKALNESDLKA